MSQALDLINWTPAAEVALLGLFIALLPSSWVVWQSRRQGLKGWPAWQKALTVATLFLTVDLVVFGAFTRLTDSGLGCPDWPGCYGQTTPLGAHADIAQAQAQHPLGPVTHDKAWIEMVHRYLATGVGALITGLMLLAWRLHRRHGGLSPWWATATFVWVCLQGAFGAFTVTLKLQPLIVTGHLLGAMLGVGLLTAQVMKLNAAPSDGATPPGAGAVHEGQAMHQTLGSMEPIGTGEPSRASWPLAVLALVAVQIAAGAWVSTNYAVLACDGFPLCQGRWWPDMDFATAFTLWRPLGQDGQGGWINLASLTAIHMAHRLVALLAVSALVWLTWACPRASDRRWLAGLTAWQVLTGLSNVVLDWPLASALGHTLGAALLVWRLVMLAMGPRHQGLSA